MGCIELDPASSITANEIVQAENYFAPYEDGLAQPWRARTLWLNPPYTRGVIEAWAAKLLHSLRSKNVQEAIWLSNNATETGWFQALSQACSCLFLPGHRIAFEVVEGGERVAKKSPRQAQALLYFGPYNIRFATVMEARVLGTPFFRAPYTTDTLR